MAEGDTILIGVTGNTPPGVHVWDHAHVEGKLQFRDVVASLQPIVNELKGRGADVVLVLSHGGFAGSSYDTTAAGWPAENAGARLAREVSGIDVVFLGHTHQQVRDSTINRVLFVQAGQWCHSAFQFTSKGVIAAGPQGASRTRARRETLRDSLGARP